jgi:Family of unknown function (DUF5898)
MNRWNNYRLRVPTHLFEQRATLIASPRPHQSLLAFYEGNITRSSTSSSPPANPATVEIVESWQPHQYAMNDFEERCKSVHFDPSGTTAFLGVSGPDTHVARVRWLLRQVVHAMRLEHDLVISRMRFRDKVCSTTIFGMDKREKIQPIGLVEIVPPGTLNLGDGTRSSWPAGEIYDRLTALASAGPKCPLALVTDSQRWRLAGLRRNLPQSSAEVNDESELDPSRRIYVSNVAKISDKKKLGRFLEGVVQLMKWSGEHISEDKNQFLRPVPWLLDGGVPVRILDLSEKKKAKLEISLDQHPSPNTNEFILHKRLGKGAHGVCYLATDSLGMACAMKSFDLSRDSRERLRTLVREECDRWNAIYRDALGDKLSWIIELEDRIYLVMPYLHCLKKRDKEALSSTTAGEEQLRAALMFFASRGYAHEDLFWRHIGRAPSNDGRSPGRIVLMDLGSVSRAPASEWGSEEQAAWIEKAMEKLENEDSYWGSSSRSDSKESSYL